MRSGAAAAVEAGHAVLAAGGAALDAVEAAVVVLEDDPEFNAGRGAALTEYGRVELDASMMDGTTRAAGAVAAVRGVRNPVRAARAVLEEGRHVLLVGPPAIEFAATAGLAFESETWFVTERERQALGRRRRRVRARHGRRRRARRRRAPGRRHLDRRRLRPAARPRRRLAAGGRRHVGRRRDRRRLLHRPRRVDHPLRARARGRRAAAPSRPRAPGGVRARDRGPRPLGRGRRPDRGQLARRGRGDVQLARHDPRLAGRRRSNCSRPSLRAKVADPVEDAAGRLYGLPLEEFTRERDATARELRKAKERDAADAVGKLPKPTQAAWAANALVREHRDLVDALLDAVDDLREAQEAAVAGKGAAALRDAATAERAAVDELVAAAKKLKPGGRKPSEATLERLRTTLQAAATDEEVRSALDRGRVVADAEGGGAWGLVPGADVPATPPPRRTKPRSRSRRVEGRGGGAPRRGRAPAGGAGAPSAARDRAARGARRAPLTRARARTRREGRRPRRRPARGRARRRRGGTRAGRRGQDRARNRPAKPPARPATPSPASRSNWTKGGQTPCASTVPTVPVKGSGPLRARAGRRGASGRRRGSCR